MIQDGDIGALDGRLLDDHERRVGGLGSHPGGMQRRFDARSKADLSVTADHAAEAVILEAWPRVPGWRSSEEAATAALPADLPGSFVLVDPRRTRELLAGRDEFTVNIGSDRRSSASRHRRHSGARGIGWRGSRSRR